MKINASLGGEEMVEMAGVMLVEVKKAGDQQGYVWVQQQLPHGLRYFNVRLYNFFGTSRH